ncbi:MAG TPA: hypothetical protein VI524_08660 [Anaerolineales bacterium]|nr:hypothetical protein [Anaerolineales bacterium]
MYREKQSQEIVRLLYKLKMVEQEYPVRMFTMRRMTFISLLARYLNVWVRIL